MCLTPLSAIFQPYHGVQLKPEYPERTTDHGQATGNLYHLRVECTFFVIYKAGREPTPHWWISVSIVIFHVTLSKPSQFTILTWTAIRNYGKVNGSQSSMFKAIDNTFIIGNKSVITSRTFSINQQSIMVTVQFLKKRLRFNLFVTLMCDCQNCHGIEDWGCCYWRKENVSFENICHSYM